MKKEVEVKLSEFLIIVLFYFISIVVSGIYRFNIVLNNLDIELIKSTKLSGYVSLITSSLFSAIVIIIISFMAYFSIKIFFLEIDTRTLIEGLINSVYVLIFFEIVRVLLTFFMFEDAIRDISSLGGIIKNLKISKWYYYDNRIKILVILSTGIIFGVVTFKKNKNYFNAILLSIIILLGFYVSTLKFSTF